MARHNTAKILGKQAHYWTYNPKGKQTIVAVHGLRGTHHGLQFIADQLPEYRFIIPDLPGFGESGPLDGKHDIPSYTKWLESFLKNLDLPEPPVLLGHSFGSIIAGHFAATSGDKLDKLILINPIAKSPNTLSQFISNGYYGLGQLLPHKLGTLLLRSKLVTRVMTIALLKTKQSSLRKRAYEQHFAYFGTFANRSSLHEAYKSSTSRHVSEAIGKLSLPVLLIVGARDEIAPLKTQRHLHQALPNASLKIIPDVGHLIHYETPEAAAQHIKEFLG